MARFGKKVSDRLFKTLLQSSVGTIASVAVKKLLTIKEKKNG